MQTPPSIIPDLIERFEREHVRYKSTGYKEAELRQEFINPFWEALGWDMTNRQGLAEAYKEVIHEDSLVIGGQTKAPDYVFRVGRERKFFLEAKAPKVDSKMDIGPAYQLKRYAWSAGLPVSILSDFEEFAVYQCTAVPKPTDAAAKDRIEYIKYTDYLDKWDFIHSTFSRDAIWQGAFDKFAAAQKGKRGTTPFDKQFLADMLEWRMALARNIARNNHDLSERELNFAVQLTLDRIIMLRICEDRGIEQYGNLATDAGLMKVIGQDKDVKVQGIYKQLIKRFRIADDRFNSGLFHFSKEKERPNFDDLTPRLTIDDKVLTSIISELYYPTSPYAFDYVPSDILGHVYEQFLGQVITLTAGHNARIEEKPEVKKAGGVYYTPTYIVDYIVKNTVGKLLDNVAQASRLSPVSNPENARLGNAPGTGGTPALHASRFKTFADLRTLTILDPACGSGSFLLGAYQFLLDWYLKYYLDNDAQKWLKSKALIELPTQDRSIKNYALSPQERKRILLTHIHGVDIDSQAVEVAKLNLMLKVLEGSGASKDEQRITFDKSERLLPDLDKNILCGNSLIGWDYFNQGDLKLAESDEVARINPMDWKDAFPAIMKRGGFDAVIGNPPYVMLQVLDERSVFDYISHKYIAATYKIDAYQVFMEQGVRLTAPEGFFGYITPNTYLRNVYSSTLRSEILSKTAVEDLQLFYYRVFEQAHVDTCTIILRKTTASKDNHTANVVQRFEMLAEGVSLQVPQSKWQQHPKLEFLLPGKEGAEALLKKLQDSNGKLGDFATAYFGIQTFDRNEFVSTTRKLKCYMPVIDGGNIRRYGLTPGTEFVDFRPTAIKSGGKAFVYEQDRIGVRQIGAVPIGTIVPKDLYTLNTIYNIFFIAKTPRTLPQVLGVIQSKLIGWYWRQVFFDQKQTFPKVKKQDLLEIPIVAEDANSSRVYAGIDRNVLTMLDLQRKLTAAGGTERTLLDRQIAATDREIDRLVYVLYGLTEEDIKIVEGDNT